MSFCTHLISSQDLEGGDDLIRGVPVGRFRGHEVDEGLEGDGAAAVGVHYAHDAIKFGFALASTNYRLTQKRRRFELKGNRSTFTGLFLHRGIQELIEEV